MFGTIETGFVGIPLIAHLVAVCTYVHSSTGVRRSGVLGLDRPLEQLFDLLGLAAIGEKLEEVVKVIDRHLEPFDRGGEVAGVESIAFLWVGGGEVVEGEVEGVLVVDRVFFVGCLGDNRCTAKS
jgi:hypothetical protein